MSSYGSAVLPRSRSRPIGLGQDTVLGETFTYIFSIQQIALQDGDRFYYNHRLFETNMRQEIQNQDFSNVIERTLGLEYLHAEVFITAKRLDLSGVSQQQVVLEGTKDIEIIIGRDIGEIIYGDGANGRGQVVDRGSFIKKMIRADEAVTNPVAPTTPATNRQVDGDTIFAKAGNDVVIGGDTDDALHGGSGDDILVGNDGDDRFDGGNGNDAMFGGLGDDDMAGNAGNDLLYAGIGDDEAFGGAGRDLIYGGAGNDNLWGGDDNDVVDGGAGNDFVAGGEGNDELFGGAGTDRLIGGTGSDTMTGGAGEDTFMFLSGSGVDLIKDFSVAEDQIDLHRYKWDAQEKGLSFGIDSLVFSKVSGGTSITGFGDGISIMLEGVTVAELEANAGKVFIFEEVVRERPGLVLSEDGLVLGIGQLPSPQPQVYYDLFL